ncbi:MAG: AAA family ATPase [Armatimonadetes bacterium CG_4_10_14_3_um_filter_66_18]|nr:MAG: AAA family ATPase [Armatimonadetes bacterium CG_4_8_14_3_um_filter_66_20]PIY53262.1 MAG: AAA family ATPase [Armatimonadetes bacterium CG_4_10_14_3_um_filter_66_18]
MKFEPNLDEVYSLKAADDGWPDTWHRFAERHMHAVQAALACQRPLLVRGEPGIGKSQLARAAAAVMHLPFLRFTMTAQTECADLLYEFDAVARLAQAQVLGRVGGTDWQEQLAVDRFVLPRPFWWALDWQGAFAQCLRYADGNENAARKLQPRRPPDWQEEQGCVLLVDEIDKAEGDVPNALLEGFGSYSFAVPEVGRHVSLPKGHAPPLVVITTNEERELPRAFVRRCLVLQMDFSKDVLLERGRDHFGKSIDPSVYEAAAEQLLKDRDAATAFGPVRPGVAEYLDLLRILSERKGKSAQVERLTQVRDFVGAKNPRQHLREAASE